MSPHRDTYGMNFTPELGVNFDAELMASADRHFEAMAECWSCGKVLGPDEGISDDDYRGFCDEACEEDFHASHSAVCR